MFKCLGFVGFLFWKEINTLIKQGLIKLSKSDSKDMVVQKIYI